MKTMQEEWEQYRDACYPDGIILEQEKETSQAFFAGGLVVAIQVIQASNRMFNDQITEGQFLHELQMLISAVQEAAKPK